MADVSFYKRELESIRGLIPLIQKEGSLELLEAGISYHFVLPLISLIELEYLGI
jgi:hypothetical protein